MRENERKARAFTGNNTKLHGMHSTKANLVTHGQLYYKIMYMCGALWDVPRLWRASGLYPPL